MLIRFKFFTVVKTQVEVFWVVAPCSVVVIYQRFGGNCCVHLHPTWRHNPDDLDLNCTVFSIKTDTNLKMLKILSAFPTKPIRT
jgi:hypothetical protein